MPKFEYKEYNKEYPAWAKNYKEVGACLKRICHDDSVILPKDETVSRLTKEYEDVLVPKKVSTYDKKKRELLPATDYYLVLENQEYEEANVPYYSIGSMNTEQTIHYRLKFQLEYAQFCLGHSFKSSGSNAMSFQDMIDSDIVSRTIDDVLKDDLSLSETGIEKTEDGYRIVVLEGPERDPIDIEVQIYELEQALISIELYKFEQIITD